MQPRGVEAQVFHQNFMPVAAVVGVYPGQSAAHGPAVPGPAVPGPAVPVAQPSVRPIGPWAFGEWREEDARELYEETKRSAILRRVALHSFWTLLANYVKSHQTKLYDYDGGDFDTMIVMANVGYRILSASGWGMAHDEIPGLEIWNHIDTWETNEGIEKLPEDVPKDIAYFWEIVTWAACQPVEIWWKRRVKRIDAKKMKHVWNQLKERDMVFGEACFLDAMPKFISEILA